LPSADRTTLACNDTSLNAHIKPGQFSRGITHACVNSDNHNLVVTYPPKAMVGVPPSVTRSTVALSQAHDGAGLTPRAISVAASSMPAHEPLRGTPARSVAESKLIRSATVESSKRISLIDGVRVKPESGKTND